MPSPANAPQQSLHAGVQRVSGFLAQKGYKAEAVWLTDAVRTAAQAAKVLEVALGQIAKSIVFRRQSDDMAVLVITSGDLRVDELKVRTLVCAQSDNLTRASAEFVKSKTGFSIGAVAPLGHTQELLTFIDERLFRFDVLWAAAGHSHAVLRLSPACPSAGL